MSNILVEGHGFAITHGDVSLNASPITVQVPVAFERAAIEQTTQNNSDVHTSAVSKLKRYGDFTHTFPFDADDYAALQAASGSVLHSIVFPDSLGTYYIYAEVLSVGELANETGERPTYEVTFHPTCLDAGGDEVEPGFTLES